MVWFCSRHDRQFAVRLQLPQLSNSGVGDCAFPRYQRKFCQLVKLAEFLQPGVGQFAGTQTKPLELGDLEQTGPAANSMMESRVVGFRPNFLPIARLGRHLVSQELHFDVRGIKRRSAGDSQ